MAVGLLAAPASAEAFPELTLPFEAGQQVCSAGIHSDDGSTGVKNAIDFSRAFRSERRRAPSAAARAHRL